eukprot:m.304672 g.304672  ORF g.304672 m.304672 type:complete len:408 (-) comp17176_c0_seq1:118-1341(-)
MMGFRALAFAALVLSFSPSGFHAAPAPAPCTDPALCTKYHEPSLINKHWGEIFSAVGKFDPRLRNPCWREGNTYHCLPRFFLTGVAKCGTTDLHDRIMMHPSVVPPAFKEPHWWTRPKGGLATYLKYFHSVDIIRKNLVTFESSASTFWDRAPRNPRLKDMLVPEAMSGLLPDAKLLFAYREPTARAWSDYRYFAFRGGHDASPEDFHGKVVTVLRNFRDCLFESAEIECVYASFMQHRAPRIGLGLYAPYLEVWLRYYNRNQLLGIRTENLHLEPRMVYSEIFSFLELPQPDHVLWDRILKAPDANVQKSNLVMLEKTRRLLSAFYRPYNERFIALLQDLRAPQISLPMTPSKAPEYAHEWFGLPVQDTVTYEELLEQPEYEDSSHNEEYSDVSHHDEEEADGDYE